MMNTTTMPNKKVISASQFVISIAKYKQSFPIYYTFRKKWISPKLISFPIV